MSEITTAAGNRVKLIHGLVKVSAFYLCRACNRYPGQLTRRDTWNAETQTVHTTYACECGHVTHADPMPC